jgi:hypothetical protein
MQGFEGQTLINMKHLWDSLLCKQACIGLNKEWKIVFGYLIFLKEVLQEK